MKLMQELNRIKNKIGLVSGRLKINEYDDIDENVSACINPKNWDVEINLRKGFEPITTKRQKAYARVKKIENGLVSLLRANALHEFAHWELPFGSDFGCPWDEYNHDLILEAVKETLPEDKQAHASYVVNAFEDLMINPRCKEFDNERFDGTLEGQVLFWDWQGIRAEQKGQDSFTPFYEAFVKLNMHLFGDRLDKSLLKKHYSNDKKIDDAVKKTIDELNLEESIQDTSVLFNRNEWPRMASIFARNLVNLLDEKPTEKFSAFLDESFGSKKQEKSGNGVEQEAKTKEGKEAIVYGRYGDDKGLSPNMEFYEQLDILYKKLAKAIPVQIEAMTRKHSLKIAPLNYRAFDSEKDDIRKIKPTKLFFTEEDGVTFGYERESITVTEKSKIQRRSFPDFKRVILDNSGTMKSSPNGSSNVGNKSIIPWGDNSRYHYALLGDYGIMNFLSNQGIAQYINHGLTLFSSTTRYKEVKFNELNELNKLRFSPEWGSTNLGIDVLKQALEGEGNFVLSISDGDIQDWDESKEDFLDLVKKNYFAHIQIGPETEFTRDLKAENLDVFYVNSGEDLSKLMVDVTMGAYRGFINK